MAVPILAENIDAPDRTSPSNATHQHHTARCLSIETEDIGISVEWYYCVNVAISVASVLRRMCVDVDAN